MTPGGFIKFHTNEGTRNILYTERFGDVTASRNADCVQDSFPAFTDTGSALTQMYGVANRNSRWNIVMIGDGYTDVHETYTDVNGNGTWDGVVYYDVNRDGVWNTGRTRAGCTGLRRSADERHRPHARQRAVRGCQRRRCAEQGRSGAIRP